MKSSTLIVYWVLFVGVFTAVFAAYDGRWMGTFLLNLIRLPFMVGIAFLAFHRKFNLPRLSMAVRIIIVLVLVCAAALLSRYIFGVAVFPTYFQNGYTFQFWNFNALFNQAFVISAGVAGYGTLVFLMEKSVWRKKREELIEEKKLAELNFYRAQVHPHFLFNTLNGIYAESIKPSGKASELILKLSDLLRFMLYECNRASIPLQSEVEVIENYIALEKLRYGERLDINLQVDAELQADTPIPPLIFLALVENAFKHGVSAQPDRSFVSIGIQRQNNELLLSVRNTDFAEGKDETGYKRGIGLTNIHRQLELIFEDRFTLNQERKNGIFETELRIPLS